MELLFSLQADSGAFQSTVHMGETSLHDYNGFVTALVLRELETFAGLDQWAEPLGRALSFLEKCESPLRPGFFAFWPRNQWPVWAPQVLEDADDTAAMASELFYYGRIDLEKAQFIASAALIPYRLEIVPEALDQPWIRPGAFLTWLHPRCVPNPIDCVVNVNVLAFLAQAEFASQPGYIEACQMVLDGIAWSARRWEHVDQLSPYYPEASELALALKNAVRKGAADLRVCLEALEQFPVARPGNDPSKVLFSVADRATLWSSTALWAARQLAVGAPSSQTVLDSRTSVCQYGKPY
ncbi:MAG: hypothetical protein ABI165_03415 [Bryobacteraceae bacterium]